MKYEILYPEAFPIVECHLEPTIDVEGRMDGGILRGLARKFLSGESLFFQELIARRGSGTVLFGHSQIGGIMDIDLDGSYGLNIQKDGFLASTQGIQIDPQAQNLVQGFLSGEGFFILNARGRGTVFVSSYGVIHPINLEDGQEVIIDNGHLVAWPDYMNYKIERASNGWISSLTSGEGVVCRFRGPGVVLIQTRNPNSFEQQLEKRIKSILG